MLKSLYSNERNSLSSRGKYYIKRMLDLVSWDLIEHLSFPSAHCARNLDNDIVQKLKTVLDNDGVILK